MLPRRRPDAVHRVYAEEQAPEAEQVPEVVEPGLVGDELPEAVEPWFADPAAAFSHRNRLAAMALLGAVVGVVAVLLMHGLHSAGGAGNAVGAGEALPSAAASVPMQPVGRQRTQVIRAVGAPRRATVVSGAPRLKAVSAIRATSAIRVASSSSSSSSPPPPPPPVVASVAAVQTAGSEFNFER